MLELVGLQRAKKPRELPRALILSLLRKHPEGLTCEQIEDRLGMLHQTASGRLTELAAGDDPLVFWTGERRENKTGRTARVWALTKAGINFMRAVG